MLDIVFCFFCYLMSKFFEEYQGIVYFLNQKGICVECVDCYILKLGMDYLFVKLKVFKDIYYEFVSGKIDSDDMFEIYCQEMVEIVWKELKVIDFVMCCSCYFFDVMDIVL